MNLRPVVLAGVLCGACTIQVAGSDQSMVIEGKVASKGSAITGATVSSGATSVTTDSSGEFSLKVNPAGKRATVKVVKEGYAPAFTGVDRREGIYHFHADVELTPPAIMTMGSDGGAMQMMLSAGGQTYGVQVPSGAVPPGTRVQVTPVAPAYGPGAMETTEGDDQRLQTGAMIYVQAVDAQGEPVALQGMGIGITPATPPTVPEMGEMQGYQLDEETAVWTPQTGTNATGRDLFAQQNGYWNADRRYLTSCIKGKLSAPNKSCGGERVKAGGLDGLYTHDTAGAGGEFCVEGPQGYAQSLSVGSKTQSVTFPRAAGSCRSNPGGCMDMGMVAVADADCPKSCDQTQADDPKGCQETTPPDNTGTGGGGGNNGGVGCGAPAGGCGVLGGSYVSARLGSGCCYYSSCTRGQLGSCADGCGNGWYEVGTSLYGPCESGNSSCLQSAANAAVRACQ